LNEAGVALLADIHFGSRVPGEGQHVRFSYAASSQAIEAGVGRMAEFIRKNTKKAA
jgi:aspartate/methionine/tyrosine aminotransferase